MKILILKGDLPNDVSAAHKVFSDISTISTNKYEIAEYASLVFKMSNEAISITTSSDVDLTSFDVVYLRDFKGYREERHAIAMYLEANGVTYFNKDNASVQHITKLTQNMAFAVSNIPMASSVYGKLNTVEAVVLEEFGFPFIAKRIDSAKGKDNYLISSKTELDAIRAELSEGRFIFQEFIPNDSDYRVIVIGDAAGNVYHKVRPNDSKHQNNMAQGATVNEVAEPPDDIVRVAVEASHVLNRQISGVDVMRNTENDRLVILEVNDNSDNFHNNSDAPEIIALDRYLSGSPG